MIHCNSQALGKINACISDIRRWMILNKLKTNDAKTEFIVFRSPMLKHDLSDLSVNVGGNVIKPSEKVRDLGVILFPLMTTLVLFVSQLTFISGILAESKIYYRLMLG